MTDLAILEKQMQASAKNTEQKEHKKETIPKFLHWCPQCQDISESCFLHLAVLWLLH